MAGDGMFNRKKQKRRQKQAARLAAEVPSRTESGSTQEHADNEPHNPEVYRFSAARPHAQSNGIDYGPSDGDDQYEPPEGDDQQYSDEDARHTHVTQSTAPHDKPPKKRKNKSHPEANLDDCSAHSHPVVSPSQPAALKPPPPPPPAPLLPSAAIRSAHRVSKDRIWNTSTAEERERIKEFWLSLEEKERRSLVKVEKEAVLKKMKEQQKHSCSCTVCGRKRTAIEEELEVLYDAYYEELEQYANHQQISLEDGTPIMPPPRIYGTHLMARLPPSRVSPTMHTERPARGRITEMIEDDEEADDEDYSDEDEEEEAYSDDELEEEPRGPAADFFNFGNSLTVQGGILTVADDLLKNDGKKFIDMMEQLAERRMQREEEAQYAAGLRHRSMQGHNHGPPLEEDEYDDEDDEEYDSQDDEEYDEDEMEALTEEQRMEEGRRMFQIFAARMFEQRVLTAYREKVARERQEKLLEELADETRLDAQREAKKAKEAQKKKDKKRQQKQAKDEEKAKREAERAAEEAAARAVEEQKVEEQRQKREEQRRKREAEKKAQDEERQKKEAEKQKKLQEARELQVELERKQREQKDREKKKREEAKKKEREERENKEREAKERKEREMAVRKEKEAKMKADKEAKERARREEQTAKQPLQISMPVPVPPLLRKLTSTAVPMQPGIQTQHVSSSQASPHLQVATPVIPKALTPVRPRQASFQGSHESSPKVTTAPSWSSTTSPKSFQPTQQQGPVPTPVPTKAANPPTSSIPQLPPLVPLAGPPGITPQPFSGMSGSPAMAGSGFPMHYGPMAPPGMTQRMPFGHDVPMYSHQPSFSGSQYRNFPNPNSIPFPPGINGIRAMPQGRGMPMDMSTTQPPLGLGTIGSPIMNSPHGIVHGTMSSHSHSRNASASFENSNFDTPNSLAQTLPIARPIPIQRPPSTPRQSEDNQQSTHAEIDDLSNHLGSSALLDDSDETPNPNSNDGRQVNYAPGGPRSGRLGFGASPMFPDPLGSAKLENFPRAVQGGPGNTWGVPPIPFGTPTVPHLQSWSNAPGPGWASSSAFGIIGGTNRPNASRPVTIRLLASQACKQLSANNLTKNGNEFHDVNMVLRQVEHSKPAHEGPIHVNELLEILDTEGNLQNGGGTFVIQKEGQRGVCVKFEPENSSMGIRGGVPGDIGSPITGHAFPAFGGPRPFQPPDGGITSPSVF